MPDSVTQILKSGPTGSKKNIAVLGDGFADADQGAYNLKVKELLLDGVFGHDYFYEDAQAFNIYRVNLISVESGVSQRVYDEMGTPSDSSDDVVVSTTLKNTSLGYIYSGSWAHCWLDSGASHPLCHVACVRPPERRQSDSDRRFDRFHQSRRQIEFDLGFLTCE